MLDVLLFVFVYCVNGGGVFSFGCIEGMSFVWFGLVVYGYVFEYLCYVCVLCLVMMVCVWVN